MVKEELTVHKALSELKILDDRIESEIEDASFIVTNKHSNTKINGKTIEDYKKSMKASYDKINDLIRRREAIKKAVSESNANTMVEINGKQYSVAVAIEMKTHGITLKEMLLNEAQSQYNKVTKAATRANDALTSQADNYVTGIYGSKEIKIDNKVIEDARKAYIEANTVDVIDPLDISEKIAVLKDEIDNFNSEVDAALSCSNAVTKITIEY